MSFKMQVLTELSCRACFVECSLDSINASDVSELFCELVGHKILPEDIPQKICSDCLEKLSIVQSFKETCDKSEKFLRQMRKQRDFPVQTIRVKASDLLKAKIDENFALKLKTEEPEISEVKELRPPTPLFIRKTRGTTVKIETKAIKKTEEPETHEIKETRPPTPILTRKKRKKQIDEITRIRKKRRCFKNEFEKVWEYDKLEKYLTENGKNRSDNHDFILTFEEKRQETSAKPVNEDREIYETKEEISTEVSCTYCSYKGIKMTFRNHFRDMDHKKLFQCAIGCDQYTLDATRYHNTITHRCYRVLYRPLECNFCQFGCSYESTMEKHCKKMHPDSISALGICEKCGEIFFCNDLKLQHIVFRCNDGDASLTIPFETIFGRDYHESRKRKPFWEDKTMIVCELCGMDVKKYKMTDHIRKFHEKLRYECDLCGRSYNEKPNLRIHMQQKHLGLNKRFECEYCDAVFNHWGNRSIHYKTKHLNDFPWPCDLCDKRFVRKSVMERHRTSHFDVFNFSCEQCGKLFKNKDRLRVHKKQLHSNDTFSCKICGKSFKNRRLVRQHMNSHQPNKYLCPVCPASFSVGFSLRGHVAAKHPEYEMPPPGTRLYNVNINELKLSSE